MDFWVAGLTMCELKFCSVPCLFPIDGSTIDFCEGFAASTSLFDKNYVYILSVSTLDKWWKTLLPKSEATFCVVFLRLPYSCCGSLKES